jgi:hypothetical protein
MKSKEQFALALRVIGVLGIIYVLRSAVRNTCPTAALLIIRCVFVLIGLYLLRGAPWVVKFAYPGCECTEKPAA